MTATLPDRDAHAGAAADAAREAEHTLLTPATCDCGGETGRCPVCDWGLGVCAVCGAAEIELQQPCEGAPTRERPDAAGVPRCEFGCDSPVPERGMACLTCGDGTEDDNAR